MEVTPPPPCPRTGQELVWKRRLYWLQGQIECVEKSSDDDTVDTGHSNGVQQ